MDFMKNSLFCFHVALLLLIVNYSSSCTVETIPDVCTYIIVCLGRPTSLSYQPCSDTPNVTFAIFSSTQETLASGYFSSTNFDAKVRYIIGAGNSWRTIESHAFRYYTRTKMINLTENNIFNINNDAFVQLVHLTTLDLSNNYIEKLQPKSLNIAHGNSLETLDLSNNKLLCLQNDVFASLINLTQLNLRNNKLASLTEDCFSNLKTLKNLHLERNELTSLNTALQPLRELQILDLSFNKIKRLSGYETNRLSALLYLNVSYNELEIVETNSFTQALELQTLDLSHNNIHSPIEAIMFMNNNLLWYLSLFDNKITTIKDLSFSFNSIKYIYLDRNNLSINITHDTMKGLSNLRKLDITKQNVTAIKEKAFVDMKHLQYLNLSRNAIKTIDNTSFKFDNENSLTVLDFSFNNLSNLYFLQYFRSNMTEIYLNCNKITILLKETFENHHKLIKLDLSENEIVVIEKHSLPMHMLQYLDVNNNKLSGNITKDMFSPAPFIKQLDLCNFKFRRINDNAFANLPVLTKLNLSSNNLEFVHSNNFINMEEMLVLDVSNNKLTEFKINQKLNNLKNIYVNNNKLTRLPNLFSNASNISIVDVSNNNISDLENAGFGNMRAIIYLKISHNNIVIFNNKHVNELTNLLNLILSFNRISEIKLSFFEKLINLELNNNNISHINNTMFEKLHSLQKLDLSVNKIKNLPPGTFQHLFSLKFLNLSSNFITNLRYGTFRGLAKTNILDLSKNLIASLDVDILHDCAELIKIIIDYNLIESIDVNRLVNVAPNLVSLSIGGNPISCKEILRAVQLKEFKKLEITSIHQILHDDNVHGIRCGNTTYLSSTTEASHDKIVDKPIKENHKEIGISSTTILLTWCVVITILAILAIFVYIYYSKRRVSILLRRQQGAYRNNSLNISSAHYNEDLLS